MGNSQRSGEVSTYPQPGIKGSLDDGCDLRSQIFARGDQGLVCGIDIDFAKRDRLLWYQQFQPDVPACERW